MIEVIDDALPKWLFNRMFDTASEMKYGIQGTGYKNDNYFSLGREMEWGEVESEIFFNGFLSLQLNFLELRRIRIGILHRDSKQIINAPHIDNWREHKVALLYLNDTDGDTVIYKNRYDWNYESKDVEGYLKNVIGVNNLEVETTVTPKANRLVIFDGSHYHSSSTPTKTQLRYAVNYNFV